MKTPLAMRRGGVTRALLLAFVTALIPSAALAADEQPRLGDSALKAAVRNVPATPAQTRRSARSATRAAQGTSGQSASFFKSKPGMVALAVMAAGVGYAVYSTSHDRIKSPGAK